MEKPAEAGYRLSGWSARTAARRDHAAHGARRSPIFHACTVAMQAVTLGGCLKHSVLDKKSQSVTESPYEDLSGCHRPARPVRNRQAAQCPLLGNLQMGPPGACRTGRAARQRVRGSTLGLASRPLAASIMRVPPAPGLTQGRTSPPAGTRALVFPVRASLPPVFLTRPDAGDFFDLLTGDVGALEDRCSA